MKTAMQELLGEMSHPNWDRLSFDARYEMFDKLLDLEKEQIMNAFESGMSEGLSMENNTLGYDANSEKYYDQTYNQNK